MARALPAVMVNDLRGKNVRAVYMVALETTGDTIYLSTRPIDFPWNGHTWLGNSWLRPSISLGESVELRTRGASVKLAGIDPTALSATLQSFNHSKTGTIYLATFSEAWLLNDVFELFHGYFDSADVRDSGVSSEILLHYETEFIRGNDASEFRMTHFSQNERYPGDFGFQYVSAVEDWSGFWGRAARPKFNRKRKIDNK